MITPYENQPALAKAIGANKLYFKREDLHPYGSHKGRSIPFMIDHYLGKGFREFAISSSGNAALAGALYIKELNKGRGDHIKLDIFIGRHIKDTKLERLNRLADDDIKIFKKENPIQALNQAVNDGKTSLRQSTDDIALLGYTSLAQELMAIKDIESVFIGTSSGTTAQALAEYFLEHHSPIKVNIVQTSSCHKIVDDFGPFDFKEEKSLADAIVDNIGYRKMQVVDLVKRTGGSGYLASNEEIETVVKLVKKNANLDISPNSALSVVGAMQALYGENKQGAMVCLICGE